MYGVSQNGTIEEDKMTIKEVLQELEKIKIMGELLMKVEPNDNKELKQN